MSQIKLQTDAKTQKRMRSVRTVDTPLEKEVRSILHRMGYRFTLRRKDLPGKPDIVLPRHHTVIFVHGCFWHETITNRGQLLGFDLAHPGVTGGKLR